MNQLKVISLLFLLSCIFYSIAQDKTDLETFIFNKGLQSSPVLYFSEKDFLNPNNDLAFLESISTFDTKGNLTRTAYKGGKRGWDYGYEYDENDRIIRKNNYDHNGDISDHEDYFYNDQGVIIYTIAYIRGNEYRNDSYDYKYDSQGNLIESFMPTGEGYEDKRKVYDPQGNLIEDYTYEGDSGYLLLKYTYKYDAQNNQIEKTEYFNEEDVMWREKYDQQGSLIEKSYYNGDGSLDRLERYTHKYDDQGNRIEWSKYNTDGSLNSQEKIKYDDQGNYIESSKYDSNGSLSEQRSCEYEYDSYLNWIKRICGSSKLTRVIEYQK